AAGWPAGAPSPSVVAALRFFGVRKVSVATPYPDWNNQQLRAYLEALGFEVLNVEGEPHAAASGNQGINDHDPEEVVAVSAARGGMRCCARARRGARSRRWPNGSSASTSRWSAPTRQASGPPTAR